MTVDNDPLTKTPVQPATAACTTACFFMALLALSLLGVLAYEALAARLDPMAAVAGLSNTAFAAVQLLYSGPAMGDMARLYPASAAANSTSFSAFTGLTAPERLEAPYIDNLPPLASVMPHMGNKTRRAELGRSGWHLIHTMGNTYPVNPTHEEQFAIVSWIRLLGMLYPCGECAEHFREMIKIHPPENNVGSRDDLSFYLCRLHNRVNIRLVHPVYDCSAVSKRWQCGCTRDAAPESIKSKEAEDEADGYIALGNGTRREMTKLEKELSVARRSLFADDYGRMLQRAEAEQMALL